MPFSRHSPRKSAMTPPARWLLPKPRAYRGRNACMFRPQPHTVRAPTTGPCASSACAAAAATVLRSPFASRLSPSCRRATAFPKKNARFRTNCEKLDCQSPCGIYNQDIKENTVIDLAQVTKGRSSGWRDGQGSCSPLLLVRRFPRSSFPRPGYTNPFGRGANVLVTKGGAPTTGDPGGGEVV